jgi:manganese/zinc/iron transport system permease protein
MIGAFSGFLGNYLSVEIPQWGGQSWDFSLPTGPMILLCASAICIVSLLLAPKNGLVSRLFRIQRFREQCRAENLLKSLWYRGGSCQASFKEIKAWQPLSFWQLRRLLTTLRGQGWIEMNGSQSVRLTKDGRYRAARIVRFHRLWEAYLVFLGQGVEKVHRSAEEMEHIITPELEKELEELLGDPKHDPHAQPIPPKEST